MRVLHIGLSSFRGGIESCILNFARELRKKDIIFDLVDVYGDGIAIEEDIKALGGKVYKIPNYKRDLVNCKTRLKKIITEGGYKHVHINMLSAASPIFVNSCKEIGVMPIIHCHNTKAIGLHRKVLHSLNCKKITKSSNFRLACSREAGEWMFGDKDFTVILNGIDVSKYKFNLENRQRIRKEVGFSEDDFVLGFVGRLDGQKNPCYLPEILASAKKYKNAKLLIVGDGPLKDQVVETARQQNVLNDIFFAGVQTDTSPWYSAFDAFVLPSLFEGFGIVALESQVSGLATLLSPFVPSEIMLSTLTQNLELTSGAENWGRAIGDLNCSLNDREKYADALEESVYSISKAAKILEEVYNKVEKYYEGA